MLAVLDLSLAEPDFITKYSVRIFDLKVFQTDMASRVLLIEQFS